MSNKHIQTVMQVAKDFKRLILCFDNDLSGNNFTKRMFKSCFEHNIQFSVVTIPKTYNGKPIKDISDAYCAGLQPNTLLSKEYCVDGIQIYLSQFDDYDSLYAYINPLAPYLNRKTKNHVIDYINECISFNSRDKKDLIKMLDRSKTQNEIAADFIREYEYDLWHDVANGMYRFNGTHWQSVNEFIIRKSFERMYDVRNNEEKSIIDKVKVQTTDENEPMPNQKNASIWQTERFILIRIIQKNHINLSVITTLKITVIIANHTITILKPMIQRLNYSCIRFSRIIQVVKRTWSIGSRNI